jgi:DNA-binding NarL/FixJ family response regulator
MARRRLAGALARGSLGLAVAVQAASVQGLNALATPPDVVVVSADDTISLRQLRKTLGPVPIVAVVSALSGSRIRRALVEGVDGIVVDTHLNECLALATRSAFFGQLVVPRMLHGTFARPSLSAREKQILGLVVLGLTNTEIATKLFVTESTVKSHLSSAFSKLGVRSRREATDLILDEENGLGVGILAIAGDERRLGPKTGATPAEVFSPA